MKDYIKPYIPLIVPEILLIAMSILADLFLPRLMSHIIDYGVLKGNVDIILSYALPMVGLAVFSVLLMTAAGYLAAKIAMGFSRDLRRGLFSHVMNLGFEQFEQFGAPSILTRATDDINQLERMAVVVLRPLVRAPLMFLGATYMALTTDVKLSGIILISAPMLLAVVVFIAKKSLPGFMRARELMDKISLRFRERLTGIRVIRAFQKESYENDHFSHINDDMRKVNERVNNYLILMLPAFNLIFNMTMIAILYFGAGRISAGSIEVGDLMAFIQYIIQIMFALSMFAMLFAFYPGAKASRDRIVEVLNTPIKKEENTLSLPAGETSLVFDNVSFAYPGAERPVLSHLSFEVKAGEKIAIIGGTGSGKSTILKLIHRFYDVTDGEIRLNGVNIQKLSQKELRRALGYAPQQAKLLKRSVRDNIGISRDKSLANDEVAHYLSVAQAYSFVSEMDEGMDSEVAQTGKNLSGGQKQRLSIARALAKEPNVLLFDDAFSALDFNTDKTLRRALTPLTEKVATIIVAQRVMTVLDCDEILVLEDGKIISRGTHDELMNTSDVYREIAASQLGEEVVYG
ncbi:ABC transporter, ATP-binding protein [Aedoeadaptatus coxii]|uniref:ABC transporter ATP-binding protein n=1 Tax=Aedoeadaptatus coxii TaxID=755172 RepID=UPI001778E882|nr:ABC transporter ATP-binding protein [Peptoniphilus coxii]CAC9926008.1 ABC transporter, ATP-binding protein [Peptoniphilus coxii]